MRNHTLAILRNFVPYIKELRPYADSVTACILMQQLDYWFDRKPNGFFKFLQPTPNNEAYREGDSWIEELGFSADEFRTAFNKIGKRYGSKREFDATENKFAPSGSRDSEYFYCSYHDKIKGLTFYFRNHDLVDRVVAEITQSSLGSRKSNIPIYGNGKCQSTETENANLRKSGKPSYVNRESQSPLNTEITTKPTTEPTLTKSAGERENFASLESEPEQPHLKTPIADQPQEIPQGHSKDPVPDQSSASANFSQKKEIHGGQRLNDRLNNVYPWRTCDRDTFKRFCAFVGNRLPKDAMPPERKGMAHIRNNEDRGDIERNEFDWEAFNEAKARRVVNAEAIAPPSAEPSIQQFHQPAEPEVSECDAIQARINAAIACGQRVNPVTLQRAKELSIDVSALEQPLAAPASEPEPAIAPPPSDNFAELRNILPIRSTPTCVNPNFELGDWEDAI